MYLGIVISLFVGVQRPCRHPNDARRPPDWTLAGVFSR
jgi:hypothetical protein